MEREISLMWFKKRNSRPTAEDAARRLVILKHVVASALVAPPREVGCAREVAEFWHWRSRTRQLIERGDAFPADEKMKAAGFHSYDDIVRISARNGAQEDTIRACNGEEHSHSGLKYGCDSMCVRQ